MAKHTPFFKFDSASWLGGSIQFTDLQTKGLFIDLCALYWEAQEPIKLDSKFKVRIREDQGTLSNLLGTLSDLEIIVQSELGITIPFLDKLMEERKAWLNKCSENGKKSAALKGTSSNKKEERRKKKEESRPKKKFTPPELFEVKAYFCENGFTEQSAVNAFKYYQEGDWRDSKGNQVKNWKQKMRGVWFKDENRIPSQPNLDNWSPC